jgi:hypothetical protein
VLGVLVASGAAFGEAPACSDQREAQLFQKLPPALQDTARRLAKDLTQAELARIEKTDLHYFHQFIDALPPGPDRQCFIQMEVDWHDFVGVRELLLQKPDACFNSGVGACP